MEENNKFWFKIKSPHNEYLLSLQTINNAKSEEILEISLIHKLETGDLEYFLQAPRDELVKDNEILSKYNTISEIFYYFVNCLNNQKIRIIRPSIFCYIMHIFDDNNHFQLSIPRKFKRIENGGAFPYNFTNEKIISDGKEHCSCFTAFTNKKGTNIIIWTIKEQKIIYLYDYDKNKKYVQDSYINNIDSIQYFHDNNEAIDYIITLSKDEENGLNIWEIEEVDCIKLSLKKTFKKNNFFCGSNIEIFSIFNCTNYDNKNSFLFVYGTFKKKIFDGISDKYNEIKCYKLDKNLNSTFWELNKKKLFFKIIRNYFKINYLDTYYDSKENELYLINCNENDIELITKPFAYYKGKNFKYKNWNLHTKAFIKESNGKLKLFDVCQYGIIVWDIKDNIKPEALLSFEQFNPFDMIILSNNYIFISGNDKLIISYFFDKENKVEYNRNKIKENYRICKITTKNNSELIITIDEYHLKCWLI